MHGTLKIFLNVRKSSLAICTQNVRLLSYTDYVLLCCIDFVLKPEPSFQKLQARFTLGAMRMCISVALLS